MQQPGLCESLRAYYAMLCTHAPSSKQKRNQFAYISYVTGDRKQRRSKITPDHFMPRVGLSVGQFCLQDLITSNDTGKSTVDTSTMDQIGQYGIGQACQKRQGGGVDLVGDRIKEITGLEPRRCIEHVYKHLEDLQSYYQDIPEDQEQHQLEVLSKILELRQLLKRL